MPLVQISSEDMARIPDGSELAIDGSKDTVILLHFQVNYE